MARGVSISRDLREVIVRMHSLQLSKRMVAHYTGVPLKTVQNIVRIYNAFGDVGGDGKSTGRKNKLSQGDVKFVVALLHKTPDLALADVQKELSKERNVHVSPSTISRCLKKAGYSYMTITKAAKEQNWTQRAAFIDTIVEYQRHELVFIDESSFDRRTSIRNKAWGMRGKRVVRMVHFHRGARHSVLPALSLDGIIHVSTTPGSFNTASFNTFIMELLDVMNPYDPVAHTKNSVIVLDNCRIHKDPEILEYIIARGMRYVFLPPYSPDYNPIELAFSSMKATFRRNRDRVDECWNDNDKAARLLVRVAGRVTPQKAEGWYRHCGY